MVRLTWDPDRRAYRDRRRADGKSDREIIRCLKRYVAREMFRLLTNPLTVHVGADLRTARNNANITLQTAAEQLNTWPVRLSRIERGLLHDNELTNRYHNGYTPKKPLDTNRSISFGSTGPTLTAPSHTHYATRAAENVNATHSPHRPVHRQLPNHTRRLG